MTVVPSSAVTFTVMVVVLSSGKVLAASRATVWAAPCATAWPLIRIVATGVVTAVSPVPIVLNELTAGVSVTWFTSVYTTASW